MSSVLVEDRVVLGTEFGNMTPHERMSEVLMVWGCCPVTTERLLRRHDAVSLHINLATTIVDPKMVKLCENQLKNSRERARWKLIEHRRLLPETSWPVQKVLDLLERVAKCPALPPELEAVYLQ